MEIMYESMAKNNLDTKSRIIFSKYKYYINLYHMFNNHYRYFDMEIFPKYIRENKLSAGKQESTYLPINAWKIIQRKF